MVNYAGVGTYGYGGGLNLLNVHNYAVGRIACRARAGKIVGSVVAQARSCLTTTCARPAARRNTARGSAIRGPRNSSGGVIRDCYRPILAIRLNVGGDLRRVANRNSNAILSAASILSDTRHGIGLLIS